MATDLSPQDVGRVFDQLYRAATEVPRFHLRSEDLQNFAGRERALRAEFFEEAARELEIVYSIVCHIPGLAVAGPRLRFREGRRALVGGSGRKRSRYTGNSSRY